MRITLRGFSCAVLLAGMLCSCQKELAQVEQPETEINMVAAEFSAVTEAGMPTRMTLGEGLKPAWEAGDKLAVWDGSLVTAFSVKKAEGSFAKFDGQVAEGSDEYYALFPHTEGITFDAEAKAFKTVIPSEQIISQGDSVCASALMGMAYAPKPAEGQAQFAFRNVCGLIKVDVPESGKIASIVISSNGDETFVGEGTVSLQEKTEGQLIQTIPVFTPAEGAGKTVILRPEGENATFEKGSYYAVVAPVEFQTGFSINMVRTDGAAGKISTDQPMKVVRNGGANLKDIVAISDWKWVITTKEQLLAWNAGDRKKTDYVELGADIDLDGENWEPHDFSGVFEGNGHKIYNISISRDGYCGFVAALDGTIRNLYLGTSDGKAYDGKSEYVYTPGATAGSWVHMGGVAASINNGALIKNVTSFVKIHTPDSDGQAKVCMGGLVSMGTGTNEIQDCVNYGEIVCDASVGVVSGASNHQLGGIMCKTDGTVTITNCKNYGNISAKGAYVDNVGGIMANPNGNSTDKAVKTHIKGCYNYGNITITKTTSAKTPMALGGIVGKLTGATVEDCHNEGNISSVCDVLTGIGGVVGIHKLDFESKITSCSNGVLNATDKGILSFNPVDGTQQMVIGGVLGYSEHGAAGKLTIQSSNNYAPIDVSYGKFRNIGGICGVVGDFTSSRDGKKSSVELLIDDCHNYGAITVTSETSYTKTDAAWQKHIGGVVGILYGSDNGVTVSNSSNEAILHSTATGDGETRIAGIVAHTRYGNIEVSSCTNNGEVKTTDKATNARPAGIISVTNAATKLDVKQCYNKKTISSSATVGTFFAGGIVAYLLGPATISECYNQGEVKATAAGGESKIGGIAGQVENVTIEKSYNQNKVSFSASEKPRMGGIVGNIVQNVTIDNCHNDTDGVVECTVAGATTCVGGLVGRWSGQGTVIRNSSNSCAVNAKVSNQSQIVGGIVGVIEEGNATGNRNELITCTNSGKIEITHGSTKDKYVRAGGVVGMIAKKSVVKVNGCKNISTGVVSLSSENAATCHLGGIIAYTHPAVECTSNENNAAVSVTSKGNLYVGGIFGYDDALNDGYSCYDVSGNTNTGDLAASTSGTTLCVGGLFGIVRKVAVANLKSDNTNYGNVTCAGGALAGRSDIATWQGKVGKNVLVNGVLWDNWAEGEEAKWLCPVATNPLTANYVDAPAN